MLNEKLFGVVKTSMLKDRNLENGAIIEQKITEKFIQLVVKDHGDIVQIKRETKECLSTYWNVTVNNNWEWKRVIKLHGITFTDFRTELEKIINKIDGEIDLDICVLEALDGIKVGKVTANLDRDEKKHNTNKKYEEKHENKKEDEGWNFFKDEETKKDDDEEIKEENIEIKEDEEKNTTNDNEKTELKEGNDSGNDVDSKKKILLALSEHTPFVFRSKEIADWTGLKAKECTRLIQELIEEGKVIISKKGKDGLYGATLDLNIEEKETKKTKPSVIVGNGFSSIQAKGK